MKKQPKTGILIAFGELFLKSAGVRHAFKTKLVQHISFYFTQQKLENKIHCFYQRIFVESNQERAIIKILKRVFGIAWFSRAWFFEAGELADVNRFVKNNYNAWLKPGQTFALYLKRDKNQVREPRNRVIDKIAKQIKRKVDLSRPHKKIFIEQRKQGWFLYIKKYPGLGGLPVGVEGRALSLMSGGIDSPVASYLMAKRGAQNIWLHFHSFPLASNKSIEKVKDLAKGFLNYQPKLKVYLAPFSEAQMQIKAKTSPKYRVLLYRRLMLKIAERIAAQENCQALITGESLGQVSSQTLTNLAITNQSVKIPILRPLIGMDKQEIITLAKKIKTYNISIKPQEDCCTLFVAKHSTAKGSLEKVKELEKGLDIKRIIRNVLRQAEIIVY